MAVRQPSLSADFLQQKIVTGVVAKWQGKGLQNPDHGFKSRRRLSYPIVRDFLQGALQKIPHV